MQFTPPPAATAPIRRSQAVPPAAMETLVRLEMARLRRERDRPTRCLVTGDSIAVGVGAELRTCETVAAKGIGSAEIARRMPRRTDASIIVSAGANDPGNPRLEANLESIRKRSGGRSITWIVPREARAARAVLRVAARFGDRTVETRGIPSRDGVHPSDYRALARTIRAGMIR